jgi:hypothetical protein
MVALIADFAADWRRLDKRTTTVSADIESLAGDLRNNSVD